MSRTSVLDTAQYQRTIRGGARAFVATHRSRELDAQEPTALPLVLTRLDSAMTARVRSCYPNAIVVPSADQLFSLAAEREANLVVADPLMDHGACGAVMRRVRYELPSILVVAYTPLNHAVVHELIALSASGIDEIVLAGCDDTPSRFLSLGARSIANPGVVEAQRLLCDRLGRMPKALGSAVNRLFNTPMRFRTTDDLAAAAYMTRRALYRNLELAGVRSPRSLIVAAKVLRASALLAGGARSLRDVASGLGYSKPEQLSRHIRYYTGRLPRELRRGPSLAEIAAKVVANI